MSKLYVILLTVLSPIVLLSALVFSPFYFLYKFVDQLPLSKEERQIA